MFWLGREVRAWIMMPSSNGNIFRITGHLSGEFAGHRWIPREKARDAELWCFLWSTPELTVEQTWWFETPSRPLWRHCNVSNYKHSFMMTFAIKLNAIILIKYPTWLWIRCKSFSILWRVRGKRCGNYYVIQAVTSHKQPRSTWLHIGSIFSYWSEKID